MFSGKELVELGSLLVLKKKMTLVHSGRSGKFRQSRGDAAAMILGQTSVADPGFESRGGVEF